MKKIAIVEDDFIISLLLEKQILKAGYSLAGKATSYEDGFRLISDETPDVILMDIKINGRADGIELMRDVRAFSSANVIYITGNNDYKTRERAEKTDPVAYLVKPVELTVLRDTIKRAAGDFQ